MKQLHVPHVILFVLLHTFHCSSKMCIISNAESCTLWNTSKICPPFFGKGNNIKNHFFKQQLDFEGLFMVLSACPHKHMVQCERANDASNVTPM